ncbi:hypothetical protein EVAR_65675_1 [Eumeta japonica]|uniref:Uncharacterized protein n=1 Tax=Eumeta variegata TaxID=151549 RepID=A0A4C1ZH50_EUMVA|nr:hypothetical protein EVAR_65675_1 [Eumeta japonica]
MVLMGFPVSGTMTKIRESKLTDRRNRFWDKPADWKSRLKNRPAVTMKQVRLQEEVNMALKKIKAEWKQETNDLHDRFDNHNMKIECHDKYLVQVLERNMDVRAAVRVQHPTTLNDSVV